jgi:prophage DNA circulation protein
MADKSEQQIKDLSKRVDGIERSVATVANAVQNVVALPQGLKTANDELKAIKTRLDTLAATVKELGVQMVLKKDLKTATKLEAEDQDREYRAREIRAQAEAKSRLDKETAARTAEIKEQKAMIDKMVSEQTLNARFMKLEVELGARVKVLEGQMAAAMARR